MKRDRSYLVRMYNATSTDDPPGSDQLETYEAWLERQLLSHIQTIEDMWVAIGNFCKAINDQEQKT